MKIVKSKLSIAIMSFGFVAVIGAISYAAINREVRKVSAESGKSWIESEKKKIPKAPVAKLAPHQTEVEKYLESMRGYLQTPPRDGVFGGDRIPTLHGKESEVIPAYKDIQSLEGKIQMSSMVVGTYTERQAKEEFENGDNRDPVTKSKLSDEDKVRITYVHFLTPNKDESEESNRVWENERKAILAFGAELRKSKPEVITKEVTVNGRASWFVGKAVHASVNSCYKCHTNIKKGEPIGYTLALLSEAKH
jgi:hypothetical protein